MARRKETAAVPAPQPRAESGPGDADDAGGVDAAATGAGLAVGILNRELRRISDETDELDAETGSLVALYARTLSTIESQRRKGGKGGDLESKSNEELLELAKQVPELRELFRGAR